MEENIILEDKWLKFCLKEIKPKTKVFSVMSKCSNCELGEIKWFPAWRHYNFIISRKHLPKKLSLLVFSDRCLLAIGEFVLNLNELQKKKVLK